MLSVEWILLLLSPVFVIAIVLEYRIAPGHYRLKDSLHNVILALLHQGADLLALSVLMPLFYWLHQFALFEVPLTVLTVAGAFLLQDFLYYWFHRASHKVHWLWLAHVVHHSSEHMNFSTAFRQSLLYPFVGMWLFWTPMILLGFVPELVLAVVAINLAFQFFVHTQLVGQLGWLERVFNTPTHHRIHHASNACYLDKNFAGVLIIWDKLFGTYTDVQPHERIRYGIVGSAPQDTLLSINFHECRILLCKLKKANGFKEKLYQLLSAPRHLE
ncbi:sterol desaturase family protein [Pseudoalteromonas rubra]|uniref:sterol desaturase family protein n=1 Tax=Pseudoalteromonas rubra TaxID=43658 RepID=UPI002DB6A484|nr:sterol desaturase family protein [Pseudoalteromonas rubra]MEC4087759.1 sterol desaturase family protein [Pseudoalteromonas rubra]